MAAADLTPFASLWARLMRNIAEPDNEQSCWTWTGPISKRYPKCNLRLPGAGRIVTIKPHRAVLVLLECGCETEHFFDLYTQYSLAGVDADHLCESNPLCINPDHLQWLDKGANVAKRWGKLNETRGELLEPDCGCDLAADSKAGPN